MKTLAEFLTCEQASKVDYIFRTECRASSSPSLSLLKCCMPYFLAFCGLFTRAVQPKKSQTAILAHGRILPLSRGSLGFASYLKRNLAKTPSTVAKSICGAFVIRPLCFISGLAEASVWFFVKIIVSSAVAWQRKRTTKEEIRRQWF